MSQSFLIPTIPKGSSSSHLCHRALLNEWPPFKESFSIRHRPFFDWDLVDAGKTAWERVKDKKKKGWNPPHNFQRSRPFVWNSDSCQKTNPYLVCFLKQRKQLISLYSSTCILSSFSLLLYKTRHDDCWIHIDCSVNKRRARDDQCW
jgi:hypothetical protein